MRTLLLFLLGLRSAAAAVDDVGAQRRSAPTPNEETASAWAAVVELLGEPEAEVTGCHPEASSEDLVGTCIFGAKAPRRRHCKASWCCSRPDKAPSVLLLSHPRSGNGWLRSQITAASGGIFTGGDHASEGNPFGRRVARALNISSIPHFFEDNIESQHRACLRLRKMHRMPPSAQAAPRVVLVRNPVDVIYGQVFDGKSTSKEFHHGLGKRFRVPLAKAKARMDTIRQEYRQWLPRRERGVARAPPVPTLLVRYEDVMRAPTRSVQKILRFLGYDFVEGALGSRQTEFRVPHPDLSCRHYEKDALAFVLAEAERLMAPMGYGPLLGDLRERCATPPPPRSPRHVYHKASRNASREHPESPLPPE